jgi:hypothetical protein
VDAGGDQDADLCISTQRSAYMVRFRDGCLHEVDDAGFVDASTGAKNGDLNIPPDAFLRRLLGYRDLGAV